MAQFNFLGTWTDSRNMLAEILRNDDVRLVPDLNYEKPKPLFITKLDDAAWQVLQERRNLYIWSSKFSTSAPRLVQIDGGPAAGKYFVDLSGGGPGLQLTLPACYEENGKVNLAPGMLSYQVQTYDPETDKWEKPTEELKQGFKEIQAAMKKHLVSCHTYPKIWIGRDAERLHEMNEAVIHGFQKERGVPSGTW